MKEDQRQKNQAQAMTHTKLSEMELNVLNFEMNKAMDVWKLGINSKNSKNDRAQTRKSKVKY